MRTGYTKDLELHSIWRRLRPRWEVTFTSRPS